MFSRLRLTAACLSSAALVAVAFGGTATASPAPSPAAGVDYSGPIPAGTTLSGVLEVPTATGGVLQGALNFGTWRNRPIESVTAYIGASTWASMTSITSQGQTKYFAHTGAHVSWSIPLVPADGSDSLENAATGADDAKYASMAQQLVAGGDGDATIRLGWETGGNWYVWSGYLDPAAYVAAFQHAVTAMRSVPGANFTFDWNYSLHSTDPALLYPGDSYVDYVGADVYDESFLPAYPATDHAAVWNTLLTEQWGLNWLAGFAADHGKRISIPEWGVNKRCDGHGGDDDPAFVRQMHTWIATHDVAYEDYANGDNSACEKYAIEDAGKSKTTFPASSVAYLAAFGTPRSVTDDPGDDPTAALPETRMAVLLPIAGAGVAFLVWNRRRRRKSLRASL